MNWSPEQLAIFDWFQAGAGNLIVKARAGTGKTTTIKAAFEHAPEPRILYAVFNKRNQKEAEGKITDTRVEVKTLHSLGFSFIKRTWRTAKPDDDVESDRAVKSGCPADDREAIGNVVKLVGFAKNAFTSVPSRDDMRKLSEDQDIDAELDRPMGRLDLLAIACRAMELAKTPDAAGRISFNDMVWLPVALGIVRPWFNLVCIDEAQDMNLPQLTMARQACASGGRVVVVGDDRQAIYGFRGAVQDGMGRMKALLRAQELSLTVTYRCPQTVVARAAELVPDYKAAPEAPMGEVTNVSEFAMMSVLKPGDAILSRLNAPLMPLALALLRRSIPARIEGRDIGRQLVGMVRSLRAKSVPDFIAKTEAWRMKQLERLEKARNAEKKIEQANDIAATLTALAEGASSVSDVEAKLNMLFADTDSTSKPAVVLSSVHKAKGLEWHRVFALAETFRAAKGGEEANIFYVAITRAQHSLHFVTKGAAAPEPTKPTTTLEAPKAPETASTVESASGEAVASEPKPSDAAPAVREPAVPASPGLGLAGAVDRGYESPLPGMVYRERGTVFAVNGVEYVTLELGAANARCAALTKTARTMKFRGAGLEEQEKVVESYGRNITVSRQIDKTEVITVMTEKQIDEFLSGKVPAGKNNKQAGIEGNNTVMKKNNKQSSSVDKVKFALDLAKAGKSEEQIQAAMKKETGADTLSPSVLYIIGREFRRVNKVAKTKVPAKAKAASAVPPTKEKKAAKAPAKAPAKAAVKPSKAPARPVEKSSPPPRPAASAAPVETPAASETPAAE